MTLIASWGGPDSNSYLSLTDANSLIPSNIFEYSAWTDATSAQKEAALAIATTQIDAYGFVGARYYWDQRLQFPRTLRESFPWNNTVTASLTEDPVYRRMRENVQLATAVQAVFIAKSGGKNIHVENVQLGLRRFRETTGPVTDEYEYKDRVSLGPLDPDAMRLLSEWIEQKRAARG